MATIVFMSLVKVYLQLVIQSIVSHLRAHAQLHRPVPIHVCSKMYANVGSTEY